MTPTPKAKGGKRPGAGRPKGSGAGKTVITRSVSMPPKTWAAIDERRGTESRGRWIARELKL